MDAAATASWANNPIAHATGLVFPTVYYCSGWPAIPAGVVVELLATFRIDTLKESGGTDEFS